MEPFVKMGGKVAKDIKVWRDVSRGAGPEQMDKDIKQSLEFSVEIYYYLWYYYNNVNDYGIIALCN